MLTNTCMKISRKSLPKKLMTKMMQQITNDSRNNTKTASKLVGEIRIKMIESMSDSDKTRNSPLVLKIDFIWEF